MKVLVPTVLVLLFVAGLVSAQEEADAPEVVTVASAVKSRSLDDIITLLQAVKIACQAGGLPSQALVNLNLGTQTVPTFTVTLQMSCDQFVTGGAGFVNAVGLSPVYEFEFGRSELAVRNMNILFESKSKNGIALSLRAVVRGGGSDERIIQWANTLPKGMVTLKKLSGWQ